MTLLTYRSADNQEHAQRLAYALKKLLYSLRVGEDTKVRLTAVTGAQKALVEYKKTNPSFQL